MNDILKQVTIARRRLMALTFMQSLAQAWTILFSVVVVALVIPKLWPLPIESRLWSYGAMATAIGIGILWAIAITVIRRPSTIQTATEIDLRVKLQERLSSSLQLDDVGRKSAIGQALLQDAQRVANRIDIRDSFSLKLDKPYFWGLLPVFLCAATFLFPDAMAPPSTANTSNAAVLTQIKSSTRELMKLVQKQKEKAEEDGLNEAADFFKQLQNKIEDLQKSDTKDTKKILSDINQLKESMQKRRDELGSSESIKKNLANLKSLDKGPAEKMTKAMQEGDFDEASEELQKIMNDLETGNLSAEQKAQLGKQLDQMVAALEQAAKEHEQAKQSLEKQIADAEQAGDIQKVAELRSKLAEKQAQDDSMAELSKMACEMRAANDAMKAGDQAAAKEAMEKMKSQLDKMGANAKQLRDLDKLMDGANECKKCANGQCDGGAGKGGLEPQWKKGMGEGPGGGERPEEETDTKFIDSQVRTEMKQGETIYGGKAGGANRKGVSRDELNQAILTSEIEDAKALENIAIPKKQRDHSKEYFDSLREGK